MANHYTHFSFQFKLSLKQLRWALALFHRMKQTMGETPSDGPILTSDTDPLTHAAFEVTRDGNGHVGIEVSQDGPDALWIRDCGDSGDVEMAVFFVQAVLEHFKLDDAVTITWANTASKPLINGFSGGAATITRDRVEAVIPEHQAEELAMARTTPCSRCHTRKDSTRFYQVEKMQVAVCDDCMEDVLDKALGTSLPPELEPSPLLQAASTVLKHFQDKAVDDMPWGDLEALRTLVNSEYEALNERIYIANKGLLCPACRSLSIEGQGGWDVEAQFASQEMSCQDCESHWRNIWELVGVADLDRGEPLEAPDQEVQVAS